MSAPTTNRQRSTGVCHVRGVGDQPDTVLPAAATYCD